MSRTINRPLPDDPHELATRLAEMSELLATSGRLVASAKYHLNVKRGDEAARIIATDVKVTVMREMLGKACAQEQYVVDLVDRVNATITHQIDIARSLLSWEKEYAKNVRGQEQSGTHTPKAGRM